MAGRLSELFNGLRGVERVLLTGPVNPDGDSIGACLALQRVLRDRGLSCDVAGVIPHRYGWLPSAKGVLLDDHVRPDYGAVIVLDGDRHRLPDSVRAAFDAASVKGIVDHHMSTTHDGYDLFWVDGAATSTCEMLYDALVEQGLPIDAHMATLLYVGAIYDTGGFRYSNTTPATHRMAARLIEAGVDHNAACIKVLMERSHAALIAAAQIYAKAELHLDGAVALARVPLSVFATHHLVLSDLEGVVDALVHLVGVEVAALLIERPGGAVKFSLRSRGRVDVCAIARDLASTGGGHRKAAGAHVTGPLASAHEPFLAAVRSRLAP